MGPLKPDQEKSVVYTVPSVNTTAEENCKKTSELKIKLCGGVLITALVDGGFLSTVYLLSPSRFGGDTKHTSHDIKRFEATFRVDGKDAKEEVKLDRDSGIAIFEDLTDDFTVVLDYNTNIAVFKNLKDNTCYFTNLEDIPIENVLEQEDDDSVALFVFNDNEEERHGKAYAIIPTSEIPADYVAKTSNEVVSNMCGRETTFWGRFVEESTTADSSRQKRQAYAYRDEDCGCPGGCCQLINNAWHCCSAIRSFIRI